jgi:hypothetical protein
MTGIAGQASRKADAARVGLVLAGYLLAMAVAFRAQLASGFDLGFGDRADGLIEIALLEHWYHVFAGHWAEWRQTGYFYPYANTLGYNDGYFLFGVVFSFWRRWFDPFWADTLNIATWKTIGFAASYALVARVLRWERPIAVLVAVLFTIANGMAVQAVHAQLQLVALVPVVGILLVLLLRAAEAGADSKAAWLAALLAAVLALWFSTGYYLAWFTLYFVLVAVVCWLVTEGPGRWLAAQALIARHWRTGLAFGAVFGVMILPFLMVYLPKLHETGGRQMIDVRPYLPSLLDIANVGPQNWLWGWTATGLEHGEHEAGFPLLVLVLVLAAVYEVLWRRPQAYPRAMRLYALALLVSWALTLQVWGLSPWALVLALVPGARGVGVILRYQLWLTLPLLVLAAGVWRGRLVRPVVATALVALLLAEQMNSESASQLSRSRQLADLAHLQPMPPQCPAFYVVTARTSDEHYKDPVIQALYPHNVDAMFLAAWLGRPTVVGYSSFNPPDWNFFRPLAPDYDARVAAYARAHRIGPLCRLDVRAPQQWRIVADAR